ncbi:transmembrane protein 18 [Lingula anatina]|uniref:Transmembrane protein 18 n=1 Tax=Lingula anatina TaxID=7574 RepID=A0A1S3IEY7_LINAN|nr:transmembrane protein 18 [Lingula anatina]|eukprot:XP_013396797.1 transmembrane protein 18 [Lingula anatina]
MRPVAVDEITGIWSYLLTIDWTETWILCLLGFHLLCYTLIYITRRTGAAQAVLFVFMLMVVYFSENINEKAAEHWRLFSKQQYFDSNGLFISLLLSTPLLLGCMAIVMLWLWEVSQLMVSLKTKQIQRQAKKQEAEEKEKKK